MVMPRSLLFPPRVRACAVIQKTGTDPGKLLPALASYDEAVAAQADGLCRTAGRDVTDVEFARALKVAGESVRLGFAAFQKTLTDSDRQGP